MGFILMVWRILRCNPFCPGGYDPVPSHGFPIRGYYSIPGTEIEQDNDAADTQEEPSQEDADAQPKRICEDYYLRRDEKQPENKH